MQRRRAGPDIRLVMLRTCQSEWIMGWIFDLNTMRMYAVPLLVVLFGVIWEVKPVFVSPRCCIMTMVVSKILLGIVQGDGPAQWSV